VLVTTDVYGCREAVVSGESGLICPSHDADALYDAMRRVCLMSKEERENMGKHGRAHVEKNFDRNEVVRKTIEAMK
jgi:galacturonosyltransferase